MKNNMPTNTDSATYSAIDRFARRITARLDDGLALLPYDVVERLRAGRVQAVAERKRVSAVASTQTSSAWSRLGSTLTLGGANGSRSWWLTLVSAVPVLALVAGIMVMGSAQDETSTFEAAEVDAALLTDALPPAAYADPGFAQYLKTRADQRN